MPKRSQAELGVHKEVREKQCDICGEWYPLYQVEEMFTGRKQTICVKCLKDGRKQLGDRLGKHYTRYVRKKGQN